MKGGGKTFWKLLLSILILLGISAGGFYKFEEFSSAKVRQFADRYSSVADFDFERALINPFDRSLYLWGVRCSLATGSSFSVERVVVDRFDDENRIPQFFKGQAERVTVPVDFLNMGSYAEDFRKMGYEKLTFDLSADYIYEDETRTLSVKHIGFSGDDLCTLNAGFELGDVRLSGPGIGGFIGTSMLEGGIEFSDRSLLGRLLDFSAELEHSDSATFRAGLQEGLQLRMQTAKSLGNGHAEEFYAGMKKFFENPERLVIRVKPVEPVPLLYMFMGRNFEELLELYGVSVEAGS